MHFCLTCSAILFLFVLAIYCEETAKNDESGRILVPTAPINVSVRSVTSTDIHLSWARPVSTQKMHYNSKSPHSAVSALPARRRPSDDSVTYHNENDATLIGLLSDVKPSEYGSSVRLLNEYYDREHFMSDEASYRLRRSYLRRHRKRRQENTTAKKDGESAPTTIPPTTVSTLEIKVDPLDMITKPITVAPLEETQPSINYVLYYEEGGLRSDRRQDRPITLNYDVRPNSIFRSDRESDIDNYVGYARNITLRVEPRRKGQKGALYTLRQLRPFTPYKIWVRAYFAPNPSTFGDSDGPSLSGSSPAIGAFDDDDPHLDVVPRLGPSSEPLYVITDVMAPQEPKILNITCTQPPGTLYIEWRRPEGFFNSLDYYFVTLRHAYPTDLPHGGYAGFPKTIPFDTTKEHMETAISLKLDTTSNTSIYTVTIIAATKSIIQENLLYNGSETLAQQVRMSLDCVPVPLAMSPALPGEASGMPGAGFAPDPLALDGTIVSLLCIAVLVLVVLGLLAVVIYWRSRLSKCLSAAYSYLEEGGTGDRVVTGGAHVRKYCKAMSSSPRRPSEKVAVPESQPPLLEGEVAILRLADPRRPPVPRSVFAAHVASLHADGDIGFSKEYELVQARSSALGHTSHYSHRPENRHKNRYLNITAYDHSRVCLLPASSNCCPESKDNKKNSKEDNCSAGNCDYVNANFIDGVVARMDDGLKTNILKKHNLIEDRRRRRAVEMESRKEQAVETPQESNLAAPEPSPQPAKANDTTTNEIESAFLNIEFSGIVESDEEEELNKGRGIGAPRPDPEDTAEPNVIDDNDESDEELDDLYMEMDGSKVQIRSEWLLWKRRYIATQGPTPSTLDAFWRMVWDHSTATIVMITNLIERGRRKCDMYWPKEGSSCYGAIEVTMIHEDIMATYTVRTFQIRHLKISSTKKSSGSKSPQDASPTSEGYDQPYRIVRQFHYTVWPDHGTPDHPLSVLHFVREAGRSAGNSSEGGVLVHCSAGVGRTGTYIVLDAMLNHLQLTDTINVFGFLSHVRTQRNFLVQTEEQYIFIHAALLEAIQSGETNVPICNTKNYLKELLASLPIESTCNKVLNKIEGDYVNLSGRSMEIARLGDESLTEGSPSVSRLKEATSSADSLRINGHASSSDRRSAHLDESEINMTSLSKGYNSRSESNLSAPEKPEFRPLSNCLDTRKAIYLNGIRTDSKSQDTNPDSKETSNVDCITDDKCIYALEEMSTDAYRRRNRDENYELLERMWSISSNGQRQRELDDGYQPKNLLEKQFKLLRRCNAICGSARAPHNEDKNRIKGILPADASRVLLVPRPGQEGSDYINAVWMQGRRRVREYVSAQHPPSALTPPSSPTDGALPPVLGPQADFWRMLWDHTCQVVVVLSDVESDRHCQRFWPTVDRQHQIYGNYRVCYLSQKKYMPHLKRYEDCGNCGRPHSRGKHGSDPPKSPAKRESVKIMFNKDVEIHESEMNGFGEDCVNSFYHRQGSIENQDEERLISPKTDEAVTNDDSKVENSAANEARNLLDRSELRIENLNKNRPDFGDDTKKAKLSARKSIANGDLFASLTEGTKKGCVGPKSPSKMSLKNFKIGSPVLKSPTKFKFPDFGAKISFSAEKSDNDKKKSDDNSDKADEFESCFEFLPTAVDTADGLTITETTLSMHSLQDDYELTVKIVECPNWMADEEIQARLSYEVSNEDPDANDRSILGRLRRNARENLDDTGVLDEFLRPFRLNFTLPEFVGKCQMEFKNSPVVIVDKFGSARCSTLCALNTAAASVSAAARDPVASKVRTSDLFVHCVPSFDAYACAALHACRRGIDTDNISLPNASVWRKPGDLLGIYASLAAYGELLDEAGFRTPLCVCDGPT